MSNSPTEQPSLAQAPILHVDLDAFFASVEILDNPDLRGRPVCVGGAGARGVIASASYEARRHGVHSAMSSLVAKRRCPELIILPGRFDRYEEYSQKFHAIVNDLTPDYEPLGLDEVFCDLSSLSALAARPMSAAQNLRLRLREELHLDCGIGVARNKLFAKLASKRSKPSFSPSGVRPGAGVVWVSPALEAQWLNELPLRALWGVGPATEKKLAQLGLIDIRDLRGFDAVTLAAHLGTSMAETIVAYSRGDDPRPVESNRELKSLGHEETFATSLVAGPAVQVQLRRHAGVVSRALRQRDQVARTVTVVARFDDLSSVTRSQTLSFGLDDADAIGEVATVLATTLDATKSLRLLGIHVAGLMERSRNQVQLSFDVGHSITSPRHGAEEISRRHQVDQSALRDVIDEIRQRYGSDSVASAALLGTSGIHVERQRGSHAFGPTSTTPKR